MGSLPMIHWSMEKKAPYMPVFAIYSCLWCVYKKVSHLPLQLGIFVFTFTVIRFHIYGAVLHLALKVFTFTGPYYIFTFRGATLAQLKWGYSLIRTSIVPTIVTSRTCYKTTVGKSTITLVACLVLSSLGQVVNILAIFSNANSLENKIIKNIPHQRYRLSLLISNNIDCHFWPRNGKIKKKKKWSDWNPG